MKKQKKQVIPKCSDCGYLVRDRQFGCPKCIIPGGPTVKFGCDDLGKRYPYCHGFIKKGMLKI